MIRSGERQDEVLSRPEEVLGRDLRDFRVEAGMEVQFSAQRREYRDFFATMELRTIRDLQTLGLVPRGVPEQELRSALAKDDEIALRVAREMLAREAPHPCPCGGKVEDQARPYGSDLRQAYTRARKLNNPTLAKLLSEQYKVHFDWDSISVSSVGAWLDRVEKSTFKATVIAAVFQDITVEKNATLLLDADTSILFGRSVRIHKTGRIVHRGGYLRIWASEIVPLGETSVRRDRTVPWRLS